MAAYKFPRHQVFTRKICSPATHCPCSQWFPRVSPVPDTRRSAFPVCLRTSHFWELGRVETTFEVEDTKHGCFSDPAQQPQKLPKNHDEVLYQLLHATGNYRASGFAAILSLASQESTEDKELENTGFKSFPVQLYFLPLYLSFKIFKHHTLQVSWFPTHVILH